MHSNHFHQETELIPHQQRTMSAVCRSRMARGKKPKKCLHWCLYYCAVIAAIDARDAEKTVFSKPYNPT